MTRTLYLLIAVIISAVGCSHRPDYKVYKVSDDFDGFAAFDMVENFVGGNQSFESVQLNISERFFPDQEPQYALHVVYEARHRLTIKQGESLVLLVDGERMPFSTLSKSATDGADRYGYGSDSDERGRGTVDDSPVRIASADGAAVLLASGTKRSRYRHRRNHHFSYPIHYGYYRPYYNFYFRPPYPLTLYHQTLPRIGRYHRYDLYPIWRYPDPYGYGPIAPPHYNFRPRHGGRDLSGYEEMVYPVSLHQLRQIAGAGDVRIRIEGRFLVYRHFTEANFAIFRRFVDESADRHGGGTAAPG